VPEAGEVLAGDVELVRKVAQGGFGAVWEGTQLAVGRRVAVKFLHPAAASDQLVVRRFRREAKALCRIRHPGVVTVHMFGVTEPEVEGMIGVPYLVMEYVEGRSLRDALKASPDARPAGDAVTLMSELLEALAEAHRNGIVHRDLKPQNVLLEDRPRRGEVPRLIDFGIAKNTRSDASDGMLTETGYMYGTPGYMAPEMIEGREPTPAVDVYACGILLYRLLSGRMPFAGKNPLAILMAHVGTPVPPLGPPYEDHPLAAVVSRALKKDPADRYADASALLVALDDVDVTTYADLVAPALDEEARTRLDVEIMSGEWDLTAVTPNLMFTGEREPVGVEEETSRVNFVPDDPAPPRVRAAPTEDRTHEVELADVLEVMDLDSAPVMAEEPDVTLDEQPTDRPPLEEPVESVPPSWIPPLALPTRPRGPVVCPFWRWFFFFLASRCCLGRRSSGSGCFSGRCEHRGWRWRTPLHAVDTGLHPLQNPDA
jgi:serine/threonine protein kinase